jgi:hypothetical protein
VKDESSAEDSSRAIARHDLEAVIRRAAELSLADTDADEQLSEEEVVRIATELGLSPRHARQALYELPDVEPTASVFSRQFGSAIITAARAVPGNADGTLRRLEDYFSTREFLQVLRKRPGRISFAPAEDTISNLARGLLRAGPRFQLARAQQVILAVRPLDERVTHVQITTDYEDQRRSAIRNSLLGGGFVGAVIGALAGFFATGLGDPSVAGTIATAFAGGAIGSMVAGPQIAGVRFRAHMKDARTELESLLDRAEHGERLEPPPAPWRRRLQMKFLGSR